jgi:hypothetical protein
MGQKSNSVYARPSDKPKPGSFSFCDLITTNQTHNQPSATLSISIGARAHPSFSRRNSQHACAIWHSTDDHNGAFMQHPAQQRGSNWPDNFMSQ